MVAPDVHVRHVELADAVDELGLGVGPPVGDVAGVHDGVDVELLGQALHQVERLRVEVDVAHVQHPDQPAVGLEHRQLRPGQVERGHVVDEVGELLAVLAEAVRARRRCRRPPSAPG